MPRFWSPGFELQRPLLSFTPSFWAQLSLLRFTSRHGGTFNHACMLDAYGMTIVEAVSQGAPSLMNSGGAVGASDLLTAHSEIFETDMSVPALDMAHQEFTMLLMTCGLPAQCHVVAQLGNTAAGHSGILLGFLHGFYNLYANLRLAAILAQAAELWQNSFKLSEMGQAAVEKARSWTEAANAATLLSLVQRAMVTDMS